MASYLHPGVYIEEIPSGSKPIEGVSTSIAAFVGASARGPAGVANYITGFGDYESDYGGVLSEDDHMGLALQAYYLNGGKAAYICRLAGEDSEASSTVVKGAGQGGTPTANPVLKISASSVGDWGNLLYVKIEKPDINSLFFDLQVGHLEDGQFEMDEEFKELSMVADTPDYALSRVNGESNLVRLSLEEAADPEESGEKYQEAKLTGGRIDNATDFSSESWPQSMTVSVNGQPARQITVNPAGLTGTLATDGDIVATAIEDAIHALSVELIYQNASCDYDSAVQRFTLESKEDESQALIGVHGGALGSLLRIGSETVQADKHTAELTGGIMNHSDTLFSNQVDPGESLEEPLVLSIDGHADITIELDSASLDMADNNALDGQEVARAVQNAVRAADARIPSYKDFSCSYNADREFILKSGTDHVRESEIAASGALAVFLKLDAGTLNPGRQQEQGTAKVVPIQFLGTNEAGEQLKDGVYHAPTANDFAAFYGNTLRKVRDVSIIVVPGEYWADDGSGNPIIAQTLAHCESTASRVVIIDPPKGMELEQGAVVSGLSLPTSTYSTLYYPWVSVANPFYHEEKNPNAEKNLSIAPSAFAAGMWAKTDGRRGVWKAPAGVEAQLNGVSGLAYHIEDLEQDQLNPAGVNCIRKLPRYGFVFWGSRTLATRADPEWRYVPVRRTAIFIEQSIYNGIQWAVFEPNDHPLWSSLKANISSFMNGLFRTGAFQGAKAKDAYFVRCGLGDTMTQGDIDAGQIIVVVGFAPLKPAEFVIVRIQQKVAQQ